MSTISKQTNYELSKLFTKPSLHWYIHYLMKNPQIPESFYQSEKFNKVLIRIEGYYTRKNPFVFKRAGFTPADVAVMSGNETGLKVLAQRGCIQNIEDARACKLKDYAQKHQPHLLKYLLKIEIGSDEKTRKKVGRARLSTMSALIHKIALCSTQCVPLFPSRFLYTQWQDFGMQIKKLLFSCPDEKFSKRNIQYTVKNIQLLSKELGFELLLSEKPYYVRDTWLSTTKIKHLLSSNSKCIPTALKRAYSLQFFQGKNSTYLTTHEFFKGLIGASREQLSNASLDYEKLISKESVRTPLFYMEGGNHYCTSNLNNKPVLLIGEDMMAIIQNQLRLQHTFDALPMNIAMNMKKHTKFFSEKLAADPDLLKTTVLEMYAQGILRIGKKNGMIETIDILKLMRESNLSAVDHKTNSKRSRILASAYGKEKSEHGYLKKAVERNLFVYPTLPKNLRGYIPIVAKYLAQKNITKEILSITFSVDDLFVIPQLFYHLDIFLHPGPKGSFFGINFDLTIRCLEEIASKQSLMRLSKRDQKLLQNYIDTTKTLKEEIGHLLLQVQQEISKARFLYLPVPGFFLAKSVNFLAHNVNFLNAITGWSPKTKRYYYITAGTSVGDQLGKILQQVFEQSLKHYCPKIDVYYVGYNPSLPQNFSEADKLLNTIGVQAGVHCLSFEWETLPHIAEE